MIIEVLAKNPKDIHTNFVIGKLKAIHQFHILPILKRHNYQTMQKILRSIEL